MQKIAIRMTLVGCVLLAIAGWLALGVQATSGKIGHVKSPAESQSKVLASAGAPVKLGAGAVTVNLSPVASKEDLASALKGLKPEEHLYIVLREIRAAREPGVLYDVYLDLPGGAQPAEGDPHAIGSLNFYNSVGVSADTPGLFFSYDITDAARQLQSRNQLSERTTITISPSGTPAANADAVIGRVELVKQ
jgi:hypothetical protein